MKNKTKKKNKNLFKNKKFWLIISSIALLYFIGGIVYINLDRDSGNVKNNKNLDKGISIKGFDYILYEDDIDIYKDELMIGFVGGSANFDVSLSYMNEKDINGSVRNDKKRIR